MTDQAVPSGAELAAAIDALPDQQRERIARQVTAPDSAPAVLTGAEVAAAYDVLDDQGKGRVSQLVGEVARRSEGRAQREAERVAQQEARETAAPTGEDATP